MSKWKYGCGVKFTVYVPKGYAYKPMTVECGSTSYTGGVNQCEECARKADLMPPPTPDYGDYDDY